MTALASQAWAEARKRDDFKSFAPWLDRIFALAREEADAVGYVGTRYDALLDDYEPGMTTDRLSALFTHLEADLVPLVDSLRDEPAPAPSHVLAREFPRRAAAAVRRRGRGGAGIRPRVRTPRRRASSVLHVDRSGRRPHRAAVLPAQLRPRILRPAARSRACAV